MPRRTSTPFFCHDLNSTFKKLAIALGDKKIVTKKFAKETLVKMAGYRNRLVHFYDEVTPSELYEIITHQLKDVEQFGRRIAQLLKQPKKFGLTIEE